MLRGTTIYTVWFLLFIYIVVDDTLAHPYEHQQKRCSVRLENALEHVRRRTMQLNRSSISNKSILDNLSSSRSKSLSQETPYNLYHHLYGQRGEGYDDFYDGGGNGEGSNENGYRGYFVKRIDYDHQQIQSPHHYPFKELLYENHFSGTEANEEVAYSARQAHKLDISRVDVEDLRVKLPTSSKTATRWVEVDKCKFNLTNSTLYTRLIFPDLTISGKVVLQPSGGKCQMILRMRHAGIEFHTTPIGFNMHDGGGDGNGGGEESRFEMMPGVASVRTDSHFAEQGFISVFAHGCQGPTGIRLRQNSKRRYGNGEQQSPTTTLMEISEPQVGLGSSAGNVHNRRWSKYNRQQQQPLSPSLSPQYDIRTEGYLKSMKPKYYTEDRHDVTVHRHIRHADVERDQMNFSDDVLNFSDDKLQNTVQPDARAFAEIFTAGVSGGSRVDNEGKHGFVNRDDINDALINELERLFSVGVRSLLTTYMQRLLQPAIKETLMENMGYMLSYG